MPSLRGEVFHFIFHFHYLSGESINARRIRKITWALAFPGLVLIVLSAHLSLSFFSSLPFFLPCSLSLTTIFPTAMSFSLFFACLYQSLNVLAALLPSSPRSPLTHHYFYFSYLYPRFYVRHCFSSLFVNLLLPSSHWQSPCGISMTGPGHHGSCSPTSSQPREVS